MLSRTGGPRVAGLIVFAAALWAQHGGMVGVFFDDGVYVALARALATGQGYVNGHLPDPFPGVHYPPLYPWALSLLWRVWPEFPANVALFQLFDAACLGLAAWGMAAHARRLPLPPQVRVPLTAAGLVAFPMLAMVGVRFSEPLFLALAAAALLLGERADRSWNVALAAGGVAGLAALTRSIGVAITAGLVIGYLARGSPRQAMWAAVGSTVLLAPWTLWVFRHAEAVPAVLAANYGTYAAELGQAGIGALLTPHALGVLSPLVRVLLPPVSAPIWYPLAAVVGALLAWGGIAGWRHARALVATLVVYVLIAAMWPYAPDRFVWAVFPWVLLLLAMGVRAAWRQADSRLVRGAIGGFAVMLVAVGVVREWRSLSTRRFTESAELISVPMRLLTTVVATETPPDAVIAVADEALMALYTGRRAVPSHLFAWEGRATRDLDPEAARAALCRLGADYIAITGPEGGSAQLVAGLTPLFRLRQGPGIYRLPCAR